MTNDEIGHAGVFRTLRETPIAAKFALLGAFVNQFGAFLQLFVVLYLIHRGYTAEQAGVALGAYAVGAILGTLFGGSFSDRLGPRWTIVLAMGGAALFTLSVTALHNLPAIVAAVALSGALTQAARPAVSALLFGLVPEARQVMVFAIYNTAINLGMIAGPLLATWLSTISWDLVFWVDAATALAYCGIAVFLIPGDRPGTAAKPDSPAAPPVPAGYRTLLTDRHYLAYLGLMLANGLVHVQLFAVLPLMLQEAGYPTWAYGTTAAVSSAVVVSCNALVTRTTQRWPVWLAVTVGWVLLVIGRGVYGLPGGLTIILAATILAAFGQVIGGPAAFAYPAKVAPSGAMGRYIGAARATFQLGYTIGPVAGVLLWHSLGRGFWAICLVFGLLVVPLGVWGMRPPRAAEPAEASADESAPAPR